MGVSALMYIQCWTEHKLKIMSPFTDCLVLQNLWNIKDLLKNVFFLAIQWKSMGSSVVWFKMFFKRSYFMFSGRKKNCGWIDKTISLNLFYL